MPLYLPFQSFFFVDDDVIKPDGVLFRFLKSGSVDNGVGVKNNDVSRTRALLPKTLGCEVDSPTNFTTSASVAIIVNGYWKILSTSASNIL